MAETLSTVWTEQFEGEKWNASNQLGVGTKSHLHPQVLIHQNTPRNIQNQQHRQDTAKISTETNNDCLWILMSNGFGSWPVFSPSLRKGKISFWLFISKRMELKNLYMDEIVALMGLLAYRSNHRMLLKSLSRCVVALYNTTHRLQIEIMFPEGGRVVKNYIYRLGNRVHRAAG